MKIKLTGFRKALKGTKTGAIGAVIMEKDQSMFHAPEIKELKICNQKIDIWAIGCVAYFCLVGYFPPTERKMQ